MTSVRDGGSVTARSMQSAASVSTAGTARSSARFRCYYETEHFECFCMGARVYDF